MPSQTITAADQWATLPVQYKGRAETVSIAVSVKETVMDGTRYVVQQSTDSGATWATTYEVADSDFVLIGGVYEYADQFEVSNRFLYRIGVPAGGYVSGGTKTVAVEV